MLVTAKPETFKANFHKSVQMIFYLARFSIKNELTRNDSSTSKIEHLERGQVRVNCNASDEPVEEWKSCKDDKGGTVEEAEGAQHGDGNDVFEIVA